MQSAEEGTIVRVLISEPACMHWMARPHLQGAAGARAQDRRQAREQVGAPLQGAAAGRGLRAGGPAAAARAVAAAAGQGRQLRHRVAPLADAGLQGQNRSQAIGMSTTDLPACWKLASTTKSPNGHASACVSPYGSMCCT